MDTQRALTCAGNVGARHPTLHRAGTSNCYYPDLPDIIVLYTTTKGTI
jgi:hypothetical protein